MKIYRTSDLWKLNSVSFDTLKSYASQVDWTGDMSDDIKYIEKYLYTTSAFQLLAAYLLKTDPSLKSKIVSVVMKNVPSPPRNPSDILDTIFKLSKGKKVKYYNSVLINEHHISKRKIDELIKETYFRGDEIDRAKRVFKALSKQYPDVKIPKLEFKDLKGRSGGYLLTTRFRGSKVIHIDKMVVDNSGMWGTDPDYVVCHEFAHAILAITKGSLAHSKAHSNLTYKLAKQFGLV